MLSSCELSGEADVTVLEMDLGSEMALECGIGAIGSESEGRVVSGWCSRSKYSSSVMNWAMVDVIWRYFDV